MRRYLSGRFHPCKLRTDLAPHIKKKDKEEKKSIEHVRTTRNFISRNTVIGPRLDLLFFKAMKVAIIQARYLEQHALEAYLEQIFGVGRASVTVRSETV
jgi:hypothetical protein